MNRLILVVVASSTLAFCHARAQDASTFVRPSEFPKQLKQQTRVSWAGMPLRRGIHSISKAYRIGIFLDRRIDPSREIDLATGDVTVSDLLARIAESSDLSISVLDGIVYIGPTDTAVKLATVSQLRRREARKFATAISARLLERRATSWTALETPRTLLQRWSDETDMKVLGVDRLPHDLWPTVDLPPLDAIDRLSILLAGFGATFEFDSAGRHVRIVPLPAKASISHSYPKRTVTAAKLQLIKERFPDAKILIGRTGYQIASTAEVHQQISALLSVSSAAQPNLPKERRFTLSVRDAPAIAVLERIARDTDRELVVAPQSRDRLEKQIAISVEQVTLRELVQATLAPAGFTFRITATKIEVLSN